MNLHPLALGVLALAFAAPAAADEARQASQDPPGFSALDGDDDGVLTRLEASKNGSLAVVFNKVDDNGDGRLDRGEYLEHMALEDLRSLREKTADFIDPD